MNSKNNYVNKQNEDEGINKKSKLKNNQYYLSIYFHYFCLFILRKPCWIY